MSDSAESAVNVRAERPGLFFLEHLVARSSAGCSAVNRPHLFGANKKKKLAVYGRPSCKRWSCPECGARNARRWVARILAAMNGEYEEENWWLWTLTTPGTISGTEASLRVLRNGWKKLYHRMKRLKKSQTGNPNFYYVRVFEHHADGTLHMHMIASWSPGDEKPEGEPPNQYWRSRWLSDNAAACGLGWRDDCRPLGENAAGLVAGYVAKYCMKSFEDSESGSDAAWPRNLRRVQCSHGWPELPDLTRDGDMKWSRPRSAVETLEELMKLANTGYRVENLETGRLWTMDDMTEYLPD